MVGVFLLSIYRKQVGAGGEVGGGGVGAGGGERVHIF